MNKLQLKSLIRNWLSKSPNRAIDLVSAIEERLHQSGGGSLHLDNRQSDALDQWISSCLGLSPADFTEQVADYVGRLIDQASNPNCLPSAGVADVSAYRMKLKVEGEPTIPFTEDEIRNQVREVLRKSKGIGE